MNFMKSKEKFTNLKDLLLFEKPKRKEKRELKQLNSFLHDIEVMTYDDLIERARKTIDFIKKQK